MRTITRYIAGGFVTTFLGTLVVLTFVMSIGVVFKVTDFIARGAPWRPIAEMFLYGIPTALAIAVPVSTLVAALLVFGRLSSDGEITAMRASGFSPLQIIAAPVTISIFLTAACLYLNSEVTPRAHAAQRQAMSNLATINPINLIEEGRFIQDFEGMTLYIGRKRGSQLADVRIYETRKKGFNRELRAKTGTVRYNAPTSELLVDLRDVRVTPFSEDKPWPVWMGSYSMKIDTIATNNPYIKREGDLSFGELADYMQDLPAHFPQFVGRDISVPIMTMAVEFNKRIVLAVSCFAFVLLGVPLGIRAHRKESSIGVALSLVLVFNFYLFVIIAESLEKIPITRPDLIIWLPVIIGVEIGIFLLRRIQ